MYHFIWQPYSTRQFPMRLRVSGVTMIAVNFAIG